MLQFHFTKQYSILWGQNVLEVLDSCLFFYILIYSFMNKLLINYSDERKILVTIKRGYKNECIHYDIYFILIYLSLFYFFFFIYNNK